MPKRLTEIYQPGDHVEILMVRGPSRHWQLGTVIAHDFPAIWVETGDGSRWFVTNSRRIRFASDDSSAAEPDDGH